MLSLYSSTIRASLLRHRCDYRVLCNGLRSKRSDLPEVSPSGSGLPPTRKHDFPFPTIYDKFPHALQCYKYDGIAALASLAGSKRLLLPFSVLTVTSAITAEMSDLLSGEQVILAAITASTLVLSHFSITLPLVNFVGFVYVDQETDEIIVSYVDFWGRRVDAKFEAHDLYFEARGNILDRLYIFLISRKTSQKFRINIRYASVFSQELLERLVTKIPDSAF